MSDRGTSVYTRALSTVGFIAVIAAALTVVITFGSVAWRLWYPAPPRVTVNIPVPFGVTETVFYIGPPDVKNGAMVVGMLWVGDLKYRDLIEAHQAPPRCRNVPDGAGCIDWLEPGETNWDEALKGRPKK
jgi:hypothetical protein